MTREEANKEIDEAVPNVITRNRVKAVLGECKTIEEFIGLRRPDMLAKYRQTALGGKSKHDLGPVAYTEIAHVQNMIAGLIRDEKASERTLKVAAEEYSARKWITREEITLIASFMDTFSVAKIDMSTIHNILQSLERDPAKREENQEEKGE